jgi:hypothetical protein|tara:strand:+ start:421 stop:813 length:393 start_codon:yes stop_codon:yes gene_type:complete
MTTQIVILNKDHINVDDEFHIGWEDKGKNWNNDWLPDTIHAVIWNTAPGDNEIQTKDPSTGDMTGNTTLSATSDAVGTTTIADLLQWAELRRLQIEEAVIDHDAAMRDDEANGTTNAVGKTWIDYDPNHS